MELIIGLTVAALVAAVFVRLVRSRAAGRRARYERGEVVPIPVRYQVFDTAPTSEPAMVTFFRLGIHAHRGAIRPGGHHPETLAGGFEPFWRLVLDQVAAGRANEREVRGMSRATIRLPAGGPAAVVLELEQDDWAVVRACTTVTP